MFNYQDIPSAHYDLRASLRLTGNKKKVAQKLAMMLRERLPEFNIQLQIAVSKQSIAETQTVAHKLHGGLCYVVTPRLTYLISQLEVACKKCPEDIPVLAPYIRSSIEVLYNELAQNFKEES